MPQIADLRDDVLVVVNPAAGAVQRSSVEDVIVQLRRSCTSVAVVVTDYAGHAADVAAKCAASGDAGLLVTVGGDGTAREVASGLCREGGSGLRPGGPALVILPFGTGNSFYREIWGERAWRSVLAGVARAEDVRIRQVDLAHIAELDELVLLGACSGLVAEALREARSFPHLSGRERYGAAVAETNRKFRPYAGRVSVDGRVVHEGSTVLANVGGGRHRGGQFLLLPRSVIDDGLLDVCVVDGSLDLTTLTELARSGAHVGRPEVVYARGRTVRIERTDGEQLSFEHDGELVSGAHGAYTIEVRAGALAVLAPAVDR